MKNLLEGLTILGLLLTFMPQSSLGAEVSGLKAKDFQSLSFNRLQSARQSYIDFMKRAEVKYYTHEKYSVQNPQGKAGGEEAFRYIKNLYSAYAATGDVCFFGGWPSKMSGSYCQAPWKHQSDSTVKEFGKAYTSEVFCGDPDQFRCNPALFGEGDNSCVSMEGTYDNLTDKCEAATEGNISDLVAGIKNDSAKAEQLAKFNQSIFGENGFCTTFQAKHNKEYDACDNLKNRIEALLDEGSTGQVDEAGEPVPYTPPAHLGESLRTLQQCEEHLPKDANGRGIMESLKAGLIACGASDPQDSMDSPSLSEIQKVAQEFDKLSFLKKLNLKNFEYKVRALMNMESAFMEVGPESKSEFNRKLTEKFPQLKNDREYQEVFERVYAEQKEAKEKGQLSRIPLKSLAANLKELVNGNPYATPPLEGVNDVCKEINETFAKKHGEDRSWLDKMLWYSDEEEKTINELKEKMNSSLNRAIEGSRVGFLLGTDHFQKNVFDPTVDFTKECVENPRYNVISSTVSENDLKTALGQAHEKIYDSFEDLADKERPFNGKYMFESSKENNADGLIKDYLKEDKLIVSDILAGTGADDQVRSAQYLCAKARDIYSRDRTLQVVSWVGAGASVVGGAACIFPLTAPIGCPVMGVGTAMGALAGGTRAYEGHNLGRTSSLNQIQKERLASAFAAERRAASEQFTSGAIELGGSAAGPAISGVAKLYKGFKAGSSARSLVAVDPMDTAGGADDVLRTLHQPRLAQNAPPPLLQKPGQLQKAGTVEVKFIDPRTGKESIRHIDSRVMAMGDLDDASRIQAIKEVFGDSLSTLDDIKAGQIKAIMEAHHKFPCAIGKCSSELLKQKLAHMKKAGVPDDVAGASIRFGITGHSDKGMAALQARSSIPSFLGKPKGDGHSVALRRRVELQDGHVNAPWTKALSELGESADGGLILRVERTLPDGTKQTEEVLGHFRGSDGDVFYLENPSGRFVLDPKDPNISVKGISAERGRIDHDGMSSGSYSKYDQALFETDPARRLQELEGRAVKIVREIDGDEIESVGDIVSANGKPQLRYQKPGISGDKYYYSNIDPEDVTQISRVYQGAQWSPKTSTNLLEEGFQQDAPVILKFRSKDFYGSQTDHAISGRYAGWVQDKKTKQLVVREADGKLRYIDFDMIDDLKTIGGEVLEFSGGLIPKH